MCKSIKIYLSVVCVCVLWSAVGAQTFAIPDANFRNYLKLRVPTAFDVNNELIISEAKAYTGDISCGGLGIADISGIQFFHSISLLNCSYNNIAFFPPIDSLIHLRRLWAHNNQLTAFPEVQKLTKLEVFNVKNNRLSSLPALSTLSLLKELDCSGNLLSTLPDLSKLSNLEVLYAYSNRLVILPDIANLLNLRIFDVQSNRLISLPDVSNNVNIAVFLCDNNYIQTLPSFAHMLELSELGFANNQVSVFPILPQNNSLTKLTGDKNRISNLPDLSALSGLREVKLAHNFLSFSDLLPLTNHSKFDTSFQFVPQNSFVLDTVIELTVGEILQLNIRLDTGVKGNTYTWFRDSVKVGETPTHSLVFSNIDISHQGFYSCEITNSNTALANLTLRVGVFEVKIRPCIALNTIGYQIDENDCKSGATISIDENELSATHRPLTAYVIPSSQNSRTYTAQVPNKIAQITPGVYSLRIEDPNKCGVTFHNYITIPNPANCTNSFTPNDDGLEDTFFIEQRGEANIYNKNGKLVKSLRSPTHWDGRDTAGEPVPIGLYIIVVDEKIRTEVVVIH